jgi:short-subunit dehydrogenase
MLGESLKTIVVTGCNKGIGYGILEKLIERPYKIIMACRSKARAEEARDKLCGKDE